MQQADSYNILSMTKCLIFDLTPAIIKVGTNVRNKGDDWQVIEYIYSYSHFFSKSQISFNGALEKKN